MIGPFCSPLDSGGSGDRRVVFSPKLGRFVTLASTLEYEYWLLLEYWLEVIWFREQPAVVVVFLDGRWRSSRPDFWVAFGPPRELWVEIKYLSELRDPKSRAHLQIRIQKIGLSAAGKVHIVITEKEVWANPTLINSLRPLLAEFTGEYPKLILGARSLIPSILHFVATNPGATIDAVLANRSASVPQELHRLALFEAIRTHLIDASVESIELSLRSMLRVKTVGGVQP